jgi:hypothetical protein
MAALSSAEGTTPRTRPQERSNRRATYDEHEATQKLFL